MTGLPGLWLPSEQAYTREPPPAEVVADEQAFTDIHGPQPGKPRPHRTTVTAGAIDDYEPEGDRP
ncbi:hypothetical protein OG749_36155 [Streptomyces nojiriensis]|uniref:hypothetical protein n=1 Tax=Streptomyces nojiriensis TaxID=66374 RepID=UPI002E19E862